jgi:two-component system sensor kinase FixL
MARNLELQKSVSGRLILLTLIMAGVAFVAVAISVWVLYQAALQQERARLAEIAQSQARLIEAVARFDAINSQSDHPQGAAAATLSQVIDAHESYGGFGETGEFTLARRDRDNIVFLLSHRHYDFDAPLPIPWASDIAEPMRLALEGKSGALIGRDYRGVMVLAAHEPVAVLDLGFVAKIDMTEIRVPFVRAGIISGIGAVVVILIGTVLFRRVSTPILERQKLEEALRQAHTELEKTVAERTAQLRETNRILTEDIARRERAEDALRRSESSLLNAQRIAKLGNWDWDIVKNELYWSDEIYRIFGFKPKEFGATYEAFLQFVHPEDRQRLQEAVDKALMKKATYSIDHRILQPDHEERVVHEEGEVIFDKAGKPVRMAGTVLDITERRKAEEHVHELQAELLHVSRLSAVGEMGSTLAHELNQPVGAIMNYVQTCRRLLVASDADVSNNVYKMLDKAVDQADRAGQVIRRLREFIGGGDTERSLENIGEVVEEACDLALIGAGEKGIKVKLDMASHLPLVLIDRIQIQQVILNLVRNSIDALAQAERKELKIGARPATDDQIEVAVCDTGLGLSDAVAEQLFEPFVSTKSSGMGVGLSISRSIIDAHGGQIWATSNQDAGVTFHFTLPVAPESDEGHVG